MGVTASLSTLLFGHQVAPSRHLTSLLKFDNERKMIDSLKFSNSTFRKQYVFLLIISEIYQQNLLFSQ